MREVSTRLDGLSGPVLDLDLDEDGEWAAVLGSPEAGARAVAVAGREHPLPEPARFPLVRLLGGGSVLVVDSRTERDRRNAQVLDSSGALRESFRAGDGVEDVLAARDAIVVTYFDEGVFGDPGPNQEGVAAFSPDGALLFGYQSHFGADAVDVADCYCACWDEARRALFFPYTGFPLVRLDARARVQQVLQPPRAVRGARALTSHGERVWFYGPYDARTAILEWRIGEPRAATVGHHPGPLRGLPGGRFLSVGTEGYSVLFVGDTK